MIPAPPCRCPGCQHTWVPVSKYQKCPRCGMLGNRNNPSRPEGTAYTPLGDALANYEATKKRGEGN